MFVLNEGYYWKSSHFADSLHGVLYLSVSNHAERMLRKPMGDFAWQMFDPQLYLSSLDARVCTKACARLATYPWFGVTGLPDFDSEEAGLKEWEQKVRNVIAKKWVGEAPTGKSIAGAASAAVQFQVDRGCTHVLLPTPLIVDREDEGQTQAEWIDAGLDASRSLDVAQPLLATVAISESAVNDVSFEDGGFIDTIVDQFSSRKDLNGVYVVVAQNQGNHPFELPAIGLRTYASLTAAFVECGFDFVFVNFADAFGLACVGLGASGFATGPSQALRRLSLTEFADEGGGLPLPHYYSHRVIGEFLPNRDLSELANHRLLRRVVDKTVFSSDLLQALSTNKSASSVAAWAESKNNVSTANRHFISRMILEGQSCAARTRPQRLSRIDNWLDDAVVEQDYLKSRLKGVANPHFAPAELWLENFRKSSP